MIKAISAMLAVVLCCTASLAQTPAWPQFRGPAGAGVADEQKPPTQIGPAKNLLWNVPVPPGASSPVIVGDRIFLTAFENGKLLTLAYNRADGKELWRREAPTKAIEAYHKTEGSPAASTPSSDGTRVVVYFGSCGLICYDLNGTELWKFTLPTAETNNDFGTGTSPVLADGKVILVRDVAKDSKLLAINAASGSLVWEVKREGFQTSYSSPCIWDTPEGKQIVVPGHIRLKAYDLKTGAEKWTVTGLPAVTCTTPVVADGKLIYAGWAPGGDATFKFPSFDDLLKQADKDGDGAISKEESENTMLKGFFDSNDTNKDGKITRDEWDAMLKYLTAGKNVALAVSPGGSGDITKTHVTWTVSKGLPYVPSPLVYQGLIYTIDTRAKLSAIDIKTGKQVYTDEAVGLTGTFGTYASPVAANGHIYLCGLDKSVVVIKAGGDFPEKVCSTKLDDRIAATPAIASNTIYIRTGKSLYAFGEGK